MILQQGDVILTMVKNLEGKKLCHLVLAEGEVTGHCHKISKGLAELFENGSTKYLNVKSDTAELTHEEHKKIIIPKGIYRVGIVKEYDHFLEESRNVMD
jgi:hypothetical protein